MLWVIVHHMLKFWNIKCCREVLGDPITTMFLYFIYVYLVVLIQHALPVIPIMAVQQFTHLGTRMYSYMLLALKKFYVDMSRKIQKQYNTNKNHVNFIMVPFLVYINQFVPEKISKIWSSVKVYVLEIYEQWSMQIFCALVELQKLFSARVPKCTS